MQVQSTGGASNPFSLGQGSQDGELKGVFLDLLIQQMQRQDPFDPMDNNQMVEQLATFSHLEQLQEINQRLAADAAATEALGGVLTETANTQMMLTLPGKEATVPGNEVDLEDGEASRLVVRTPQGGTYTAQVKDASGEVVGTFEGSLAKGFSEIRWDGTDGEGEALEDGTYTIEIQAYAGGDTESPMPAAAFRVGLVETVLFDSDGTWVMIDGRRYSIGQIVEVGLPTSKDS